MWLLRVSCASLKGESFCCIPLSLISPQDLQILRKAARRGATPKALFAVNRWDQIPRQHRAKLAGTSRTRRRLRAGMADSRCPGCVLRVPGWRVPRVQVRLRGRFCRSLRDLAIGVVGTPHLERHHHTKPAGTSGTRRRLRVRAPDSRCPACEPARAAVAGTRSPA